MQDYKLPKPLYYQTLWFIRRYYDILTEYNNSIANKTKDSDGMPRSGRISDPTARDAIRLAELSEDIESITRALNYVPEDYRQGIIDNIVDRKRYPFYAGESTWKRWRRRFIYMVAYYKNWLGGDL